MSCDERKERILAAVRRVFSRKGLEGATTRELAREAGVSEALLYKHFPSKEALHEAMLASSCDAWFGPTREKILALNPSTSTLVITIHAMASTLLARRPEEIDGMLRLYLRSIACDGEFARMLVKSRIAPQVSKLKESIQAAIGTGDIEKSKSLPEVQAWLVDRLVGSMMFDLLPANPIVDYGVSREKLIEQVTLFSLRGIGLKEEAIRRYYDPKAFALLAA